jgi:prephenate dehydrogenase
MWTEILLSNRQAVAGGLRELIAILDRAAAHLESGNQGAEAYLYELLASAKVRRDTL